MKKKIIAIDELINQINQLKEGFLYTKSDRIKNQEKVLITYDNDNYTLPLEEMNGFKYRMGIFQIEEVIQNLKTQTKDPDTENCIKAINYYIENDAFI
jgi:hypothetical protein